MVFVPAELLQVVPHIEELDPFFSWARTSIPSMILEPIVILDTGR